MPRQCSEHCGNRWQSVPMVTTSCQVPLDNHRTAHASAGKKIVETESPFCPNGHGGMTMQVTLQQNLYWASEQSHNKQHLNLDGLAGLRESRCPRDINWQQRRRPQRTSGLLSDVAVSTWTTTRFANQDIGTAGLASREVWRTRDGMFFQFLRRAWSSSLAGHPFRGRCHVVSGCQSEQRQSSMSHRTMKWTLTT